jgi:HAD superfamily hydrolase (TIGR01509 family)
MVETILFDADGVVINSRKKYFSQRLIEELGVQSEASTTFVTNFLLPAMVGKADVKVGLEQLISEARISMNVDQLLQFWWDGEKELNAEILETAKKLKQKGKKLYLASDQEKYRAEFIMNQMSLVEYFDGGFFSCDLHFAKHDPEFWQEIIKQLSPTPPNAMLFFDDDGKNVEVAKTAGLNAKLFMNNEIFHQDINELIKL